jgi:hypothetical protein
MSYGAATNVSLGCSSPGEDNVHGRSSANPGRRKLKSVARAIALVAAPIVAALMLATPKAEATPNFARQTGRNCNFCHRGVPRLNDTGLAFKNNGFLFPNSNKPAEEDRKDTPPS